MEDKKALSLIIEEARLNTVQAVNQIRKASGLPAYLFESILLSILLDVRSEKSYEISHDLAVCQIKSEPKEDKKEGEE